MMKKAAIFLSAIVLAALPPVISSAEYVPTLSAKSAILINADTGTILYEKNADEERAIASTTKIMSALLTIEAGNLDRTFKVDNYAICVEGTTKGLQKDDIVTRRALCYGMLLPSGNDASQAAAVSVSGSIAEFAKLMNARAKQLGMNNTNYVNPSGLDADGHYSTAHDLALLTRAALENPTFADICQQSEVQLEYGNPPYRRWLKNNNKLLYMYDGCIGVKTGFTDDARRCLVSAAERDGATLIAVTLNAPDDWKDHASLFDYGFSKCERKDIDYDISSYSVTVVGGEKDSVPLKYSEPPYLHLTDEEMKYVKVGVDTLPFLYGGFEAGEPAGEITFYYKTTPLKSFQLLTSEGCPVKKETLTGWERFKLFIKELFN